MKKLASIFAIAFLMTLGFNAAAQSSGNSETATANASATIIAPISISKVLDLRFGTITKTATAGTVTLTPTENLGVTYSADDMATTLTARGAAKFNIVGEAGAHFAVNVPATITLNGTGSNTMTITTSKNLATANNTLTEGSAVLYVGGVLAVGANQTVGSYSNTFDVTVSYE
jgi:hypothetical protein